MSSQQIIEDTFAGNAVPVGTVDGVVEGVVAGSEAGDGAGAAALAAGALVDAAGQVALLGFCSRDYDALSDAAALAGQKTLARLQHELDTRKAWMAKTLAQRSRWELGQSGLAKQQGFLTPEDLIQKLTGTTKAESRKLVGVGQMLAETEEADARQAAADADAEAEAARRLLDQELHPDGDPGIDDPDGIDPDGQGEFIKSTFDSFTSPRRGGVRFVDTDRAAWARRVHDDPRSTNQITCDGFFDLIKAGTTINPNEMLGGRRPTVQILTTAIPDAPAARPAGAAGTIGTGETTGATGATGATGTTGTAETAETAGAAGTARSAGTQRSAQPEHPVTPAEPTALDHPHPPGFVRDADDILIGLPEQPRQTGHGYIEGNTAPVSAETIERLICDSGTVEIRFDELNRPLDVGHEQRLFNRAQRRALAARDGGCRWPGCDRPPAFTEAHHIEHWNRDQGRTDINHGILLCRTHHLLLHNQRWQIFENQGQYWLRPPATIDPGQRLITMPRRAQNQLLDPSDPPSP